MKSKNNCVGKVKIGKKTSKSSTRRLKGKEKNWEENLNPHHGFLIKFSL